MPIEHPTIIEPGVSSPAVADPSPAAKPESTPTATPPGDGDKTAKAEAPALNAEEAAAKAAADAAAKEDPGKIDPNRFDQHPRFQELIKGNSEAQAAIAALKAQNEMLAKQMTSVTNRPSEPNPKTAQVRDFSKEVEELAAKAETGDLSMGEILPKLTQIIQAQTAEQMTRVASEQERNIKASSLEQQFLTKNPDFIELVQSGALISIKQADPLQDDFTAYQTFKRQEAEASIETKVNEAIERTRKETEAQILKNLKAKGLADTLGEGPSHTPTDQSGIDSRLKDPKKHGGETLLLAQRKAERRAAKERGF